MRRQMAGTERVELPLTEPESVVLPLDEVPICHFVRLSARRNTIRHCLPVCNSFFWRSCDRTSHERQRWPAGGAVVGPAPLRAGGDRRRGRTAPGAPTYAARAARCPKARPRVARRRAVRRGRSGRCSPRARAARSSSSGQSPQRPAAGRSRSSRARRTVPGSSRQSGARRRSGSASLPCARRNLCCRSRQG